jgi:hypothetical protein
VHAKFKLQTSNFDSDETEEPDYSRRSQDTSDLEILLIFEDLLIRSRCGNYYLLIQVGGKHHGHECRPTGTLGRFPDFCEIKASQP